MKPNLPSFLLNKSGKDTKINFIFWRRKNTSNIITLPICGYAMIQARLQQYVNHELSDVQPGFRKGRGTKGQIANSAGPWIKQQSSRKTPISALLPMPKPLTVCITINCGKFKRWEYHTT